jgi:hypothetical protein
MSRRAFVTPDSAPENLECRGVFVPVGQSWEAILTGALYALTLPDSFEQVAGISPEDTAAVYQEMFDAWNDKRCSMFPGMVVEAAGGDVPSEKWLPCDGAAYQQTDYPSLYAAIGGAYGNAGAGTFRVPSMAGRMPVGTGTGAGLTRARWPTLVGKKLTN